MKSSKSNRKSPTIVTQSEEKSLVYTHVDAPEILRRKAPLDDKE